MNELAPGGGGGEMVGLNPQLLQGMIRTMNSSSGDALSLVNGYIGQLSHVGLDTSGMSRAANDLTWAQDQLAMLNRRQSMAAAMEAQDPQLGPLVTAGAGSLDFATNQAAAQAGKSDGANALAAIQNRGNDTSVLAELSKYADDPAYLAAFFQALGPQGLTGLGLQVSGYKQEGDNSEYENWAKTVGGAFATATYQMPYKSSWLENLQIPDDISADPADPQLALIQPFLENGVYSPTWLKPLGQYALEQAYIQGRAPGMESLPPDLDGIWTAIADNPAYDTLFYKQNFSNNDNPDFSISGIMTNMYLTHSIDDSAFAAMVRSGTIAPSWATDTSAYAANAQLTVKYFGDDPGLRTSGAIRQAMGAIAINYFGDLTASVRGAAPGLGSKDMPDWAVTASESEWASFMQEAMRDKTTAATLLTFYSAWAHSQPDDSYPSEGGGPSVPLDQGFWNDASLGMLRDFMAHNYQVAGAPAGGTSSIADIAAAGGSAILTSLVFGPEAGLADALIEGGKDAFQTAAEDDLTQVFGGDGPPQPVNDAALTQLTGIQQNWSQIVNNWYDAGNRATSTTYMKQPYDGNPASYITEFSGPGKNANFIQNGQIIDPSTMNASQLAAYNAWLQDPAIVSANREEFISKGLGQLLDQYAQGYAGS